MRSSTWTVAAALLTWAWSTHAIGQIGGSCTYVSHPGTCSIVSVERTASSIRQKGVAGGPGYEGYDVKFTYAGEAPRSDPKVVELLGRTHSLRLLNSWYPGPRYLEKYGITRRKALACSLNVRQSGSCTPTTFSFPAVDLTDYFESVR